MSKVEEKIPVLSKEIEYNQLNKENFILSNSKTQHYLKINNTTYQLLSIIDGKRNLRELCRIMNQKLNSDISIEFLDKLIYNNLVSYGVLLGYDEKIKPYKKPKYLKLSFIIINKKIISKIVPLFYFLFYRRIFPFVVFIGVLLIIISIFLNIDLYSSFNIKEGFIFFIIQGAINSFFHEIGHATACNYFGGKHGGIGGGFYFFSPVLFADVTDVWKLKKFQRVIVNVSGVYFELVSCSVFCLLGYILGNNAMIVISVTIFLFTLQNLLPFIRYDGYWVLSDLLNLPNLMKHSSNKVKEKIIELGKMKLHKWSKLDIILFFYGTFNLFFLGMFIYYVLIVDPYSIIYFFKNIYLLVVNFFNGEVITLSEYSKFIIPLAFYFLLFNFAKKIFLKKKQKENKKKLAKKMRL